MIGFAPIQKKVDEYGNPLPETTLPGGGVTSPPLRPPVTNPAPINTRPIGLAPLPVNLRPPLTNPPPPKSSLTPDPNNTKIDKRSPAPDGATQTSQFNWDAYEAAMGNYANAAEGGDKLFAGQYGEVDKSLKAQQENVQSETSTMARRAAEMNALRGGSGQGGGAQAGAAQAALGGAQLGNAAISNAANQRMGITGERIKYKQGIAQQQLQLIQQASQQATSTEDKERLAAAEIEMNKYTARMGAIEGLLSSGQDIDPATIQALLSGDFSGVGGGATGGDRASGGDMTKATYGGIDYSQSSFIQEGDTAVLNRPGDKDPIKMPMSKVNSGVAEMTKKVPALQNYVNRPGAWSTARQFYMMHPEMDATEAGIELSQLLAQMYGA